MPTEVAFSTSRTIQSETDLGHVATDLYQRIRVLADCRVDSDSTVETTLVLVEAGGAPAHLDRHHLDPDEPVQRTYEVPGTELDITAGPTQAGSCDIDVWKWGHKAPGESVVHVPTMSTLAAVNGGRTFSGTVGHAKGLATSGPEHPGLTRDARLLRSSQTSVSSLG